MNGWQEVNFKDFVTLQRGFDLPQTKRISGKYPVVASTSISGNHIEYKVKGPCVATGRSGALGEVLYIEENCWPLNTTLWVKDFKNNDPKFVFYKLKTLNLKEYNSGVGVPTLNRNHLDFIKIYVPVRTTQKKITEIISLYDNLIENNQKRIKILEEMAQRLYTEWFVNFRFPGHEKTKFVDSGTDFGMIPERWMVKQLNESVAINPSYKIQGPGDVIHVPMECLSNNSSAVDTNKTYKKTTKSGPKFTNGDTLFARITPCLQNGKTGLVNFLNEGEVGCGSTEFIVLSPKVLTSSYIYLLCRTSDFRETAILTMVGASGRQRVRSEFFISYKVIIPDNKILSKFEGIAANYFYKVRLLTQLNLSLSKIRNLLIENLVTGKRKLNE